MIRATRISFEKRYSDDSGVEFGVRLRPDRHNGGHVVEFERINTIDFPLDQLDWLIKSLERIRAVSSEGGDKP